MSNSLSRYIPSEVLTFIQSRETVLEVDKLGQPLDPIFLLRPFLADFDKVDASRITVVVDAFKALQKFLRFSRLRVVCNQVTNISSSLLVWPSSVN